jgi:hypothetical protein
MFTHIARAHACAYARTRTHACTPVHNILISMMNLWLLISGYEYLLYESPRWKPGFRFTSGINFFLPGLVRARFWIFVCCQNFHLSVVCSLSGVCWRCLVWFCEFGMVCWGFDMVWCRLGMLWQCGVVFQCIENKLTTNLKLNGFEKMWVDFDRFEYRLESIWTLRKRPSKSPFTIPQGV